MPIVITALNTGMRKEEIVSLTWDKVDFENPAIRVEHTKNGEFRTIPMNQLLLERLKKVDKQSDFVFHKDDGMRFGNVRTAFSAAVRRAGIEKYSA